MFSELGALFRTTLRQAEKSDARLDIRRHDPEEQKKKSDQDQDKNEPSLLWDDSTQVSIEALRNFLVGFLKSKGDAVPEGEKPAVVSRPERTTNINPRAARAARAYGTTAAHAESQTMLPDDTATQNDDNIDLSDLLEADELRTIHVLIHELDLLARRGIQTLEIEKADSFLEALVRAVRAKKTQS